RARRPATRGGGGAHLGPASARDPVAVVRARDPPGTGALPSVQRPPDPAHGDIRVRRPGRLHPRPGQPRRADVDVGTLALLRRAAGPRRRPPGDAFGGRVLRRARPTPPRPL